VGESVAANFTRQPPAYAAFTSSRAGGFRLSSISLVLLCSIHVGAVLQYKLLLVN
jgi:hypothetical protein